MKIGETLAAGIIGIGLVTAFGLHASGWGQLLTSTSQAGSKIFGTAIKG